MSASITFFPVSNGDMTLLKLDNGQNILIDMNIRAAADDEDDETPNVAKDLRGRIDRDDDGRLYVDAFLLSHPHSDHISGLRNHFHLGPPKDWKKKDDKILIREMWSSPVVFRRAEPAAKASAKTPKHGGRRPAGACSFSARRGWRLPRATVS